MRRFRYDMIGAGYALYPENLHPESHMKQLGFKYLDAECFGAFDSWVFDCIEWPATWPSFIKDVSGRGKEIQQ